MRQSRRYLSLLSAMLLIAVGATNAIADLTVAASPQAILSARVLLKVAVQISCTAFDDPSVPNFSQDGILSVEQASGREIATGEAFILAPIVCDNTAHLYEVSMLADPSGPPFHGGQAAVIVFARACGILGGQEVCQEAQAGPQLINIRGGGR